MVKTTGMNSFEDFVIKYAMEYYQDSYEKIHGKESFTQKEIIQIQLHMVQQNNYVCGSIEDVIFLRKIWQIGLQRCFRFF